MDRTRLVLTRKAQQGVWIGDTFIKCELPKGVTVKLVIEARKDVAIVREELRARAA